MGGFKKSKDLASIAVDPMAVLAGIGDRKQRQGIERWFFFFKFDLFEAMTSNFTIAAINLPYLKNLVAASKTFNNEFRGCQNPICHI